MDESRIYSTSAVVIGVLPFILWFVDVFAPRSMESGGFIRDLSPLYHFGIAVVFLICAFFAWGIANAIDNKKVQRMHVLHILGVAFTIGIVQSLAKNISGHSSVYAFVTASMLILSVLVLSGFCAGTVYTIKKYG
jgi:hypothetical protein